VIGDRTGRRFRAGDRVQVVLDRILAQERRLQFSIAEEGLVLTGKPVWKAAKGRKKRPEKSPPNGSAGKRAPARKARRRRY